MANQRGFTLIEMMVTISILAILAAIASPSMAPFIAKQRTKALTQNLTDSIQLARSEALANGNIYRLIPTQNNDWSEGWQIIFEGANREQTVFKNHSAAPRNIQVDSVSRSGNKNLITFNQNARVNSMANFDISHQQYPQYRYCIRVAASGNVSAHQGACDDF